ncbi:hypothetical protein [Streptomyces sp. NPDC001903]|uniref:hypothetical protein n=1 Tax=Streptomyces sp. NPDC001903 TaxID=3364622 RepID=UPI00368DBDD7
MKHVRTLAVSVAVALAAGAGIAYAQQGASASADAEPIALHAVGGTVTLAPGQAGQVRTSPCPAGEVAISGSVVAGNPGDFSISADSAYWDGVPRGWFFNGRNTSGSALNVYAWAFCTAGTVPTLAGAEQSGPGSWQMLGPGTPAAR